MDAIVMPANVSVTGRKNIWFLRAAYAFSLIGMALICFLNYQANSTHDVAAHELVNFTEEFQKLELMAESVNDSAVRLQELLSRDVSTDETKADHVAHAGISVDTLNAKVARGLEQTKILKGIYDHQAKVIGELRFSDKALQQIKYSVYRYSQFFRTDQLTGALFGDELPKQVTSLVFNYKVLALKSRSIIRKIILERHEYLGDWSTKKHLEFIVMTLTALLGIAVVIFLPVDIAFRRLLRGLEIKGREAGAALEDAKAADRAKSEFLATMSHEIRTPMNGVLGMAELLDKTDLDERQKTFSSVILKSSNALLSIINDILDFSKIDAKQLELQEEACDVGELVGEIATLLATKANEKDVELAVRIQPDMPKSVLVDGLRLRQIIINILGNAIKFTEKGHVFVNVSNLESDNTDHARLLFEVEDTGIGITEDKIGSIFDKFSQADGSNTRRFEGTGLGLAISARLVEMMGGRICVNSEIGVGSKFYFSLDLPIEDSNSFENIVEIDPNTQIRALVVDDNEVNRTILVEQLSSWGYECIAVESGAMALEFLNAAQSQHGIKIDIVVLDFQMPELTGADVLKEIRNTEAIADTKVLLLSSVDQSDLIIPLNKYGLNGHLSKPVRGSELQVVVDQILTSSHAKKLRLMAHSMAETDAQSKVFTEPNTLNLREQSLTGDENVASKNSGDLNILVCEDNEVNQLVISQYLEMTDYTFKIVANGKLGVSEWEASHPRLILMDVSMPEMNGRQATSRIREIEIERDMCRTPIIGVTAHAQIKDRDECLESGMDDVLTKPLASELLFDMLDKWMDPSSSKKVAHSAQII